MNTSLFRSQVTQAKQASWLGGIHLAHHPRFSFIAGVALVLACAIITFGAWGKVARKVRVPGILMPQTGTIELSSATSGALLEQLVQEGDWVQQGQVLFVVNTDKTSAEGSTFALLDSHLAQRRSTLLAERTSRENLHEQRQTQLKDRIRSLAHETIQATQEYALAQRRVVLAHKTSQRFEQMAKEGFVSDLQAQNKQEELIDLQSRTENSQRSGIALAREHSAAQSDLASLQKQLSIDLLQIDRSLASLKQEATENQSRKTSGVVAPQDLPHGQGTALLASTQSSEPLYRIQVALASQHVLAFGETHLLRPGMTLEADIIHDVRGVWEWIFEPLLAIHARQKTS